ncbi:uncharacterized protein LOC106141610 [Amyelois transitella]|uniref:uncharacterized protein LOC106141610 n=1 Tax=Amyelois transitella TaxID=680683 RepID=UPI0029905825|nr:uncharacterized protein LOC106141610 [Amyelois transitella]
MSTLQKQERKMVFDVYNYFLNDNNITESQKKTAEATKKSISTVKRIIKEGKSSDFSGVFKTPGKKRERIKTVTGIDGYNKGIIRRCIHNFHLLKNELPSINELYVHASKTKGLKTPIPKDQRVIIVHAGSESGFVPNALLTIRSGMKSGDYHGGITCENYEKWVRTQLLPNLPPRSVVVLDNALYHNKEANVIPNSNAKKSDMQAWLLEKEIPFTPDMLKPQLYHLIKKNKDRYKKFSIDSILNANGHDVLRLPPQHLDLNPIDMAWAVIKGYVSSKNVGWNVPLIIDSVKEKVNAMSPHDWKNLCDKVKEIEVAYVENDNMIDEMTDQFTIDKGDSDSSDSDMSTDSEDEPGPSGPGPDPIAFEYVQCVMSDSE